jgi:hypothetical protein
MSANKNSNKQSLYDVHPVPEKMLIRPYLKDKEYDMEELKNMMPKAAAKQLLAEASTHASRKTRRKAVKAHLVQEFHDAHIGE